MLQTAVKGGRKLKLVEVTRVGGQRSFMLWGVVQEGWFWHMGNPSKRIWARRVQMKGGIEPGNKTALA